MLNLKDLFGTAVTEINISLNSRLSQRSGKWLLLLETQVADSHYLGNSTLSKIIKNHHLFIALFSQLSTEGDCIIIYPEGQFNDHPMPIMGHGISELSWEGARLIQEQLIANQVHLFFITNSFFPQCIFMHLLVFSAAAKTSSCL